MIVVLIVACQPEDVEIAQYDGTLYNFVFPENFGDPELPKDNILTKEDWNRVKWHIIVDEYLITHAGLLPAHVEHLEDKSLESINDFLNRQTVKANKAMASGVNHWFWSAGQARGGFARHSGIVWTDWNYEFEPIPGIAQICGHSNGRNIRQFGVVHPDNWCIDCHLNEYLIIENGKLEIKKYIDL